MPKGATVLRELPMGHNRAEAQPTEQGATGKGREGSPSLGLKR